MHIDAIFKTSSAPRLDGSESPPDLLLLYCIQPCSHSALLGPGASLGRSPWRTQANLSSLFFLGFVVHLMLLRNVFHVGFDLETFERDLKH